MRFRKWPKPTAYVETSRKRAAFLYWPMELLMPKNRMAVHDPQDVLPPVTIEMLMGDVMRFTQIDAEGRVNVVTLAARHGPPHRAFDGVRREQSPPT